MFTVTAQHCELKTYGSPHSGNYGKQFYAQIEADMPLPIAEPRSFHIIATAWGETAREAYATAWHRLRWEMRCKHTPNYVLTIEDGSEPDCDFEALLSEAQLAARYPRYHELMQFEQADSIVIRSDCHTITLKQWAS